MSCNKTQYHKNAFSTECAASVNLILSIKCRYCVPDYGQPFIWRCGDGSACLSYAYYSIAPSEQTGSRNVREYKIVKNKNQQPYLCVPLLLEVENRLRTRVRGHAL